MSGVLALFERSRTHRRIHVASLDPCCHDPESIREKVLVAVDAGTDAFFLGGSTDVTGELVESFARSIRSALDSLPDNQRPPLILFPSSAATGSAPSADAVLFLSVVNSRNVRFMIGEQAKAAPFLPTLGIEPLGCAMILVEPGGTVGRVTEADLISRDDPTRAVGYASAAAAFGFQLIYLNAGSGSDLPVPIEMIKAVSESIRIPLIVGGAIKTSAQATAAVEAGADVVVTGSAVEECVDLHATVAALSGSIHAAKPVEAK
jgi:phosphoglycerol geranylgeranyltransferase